MLRYHLNHIAFQDCSFPWGKKNISNICTCFTFLGVALNFKHPCWSPPPASTWHQINRIPKPLWVWSLSSELRSWPWPWVIPQIRFYLVCVLLASTCKSGQYIVSKHLLFARVVLSNGIQQWAIHAPCPHGGYDLMGCKTIKQVQSLDRGNPWRNSQKRWCPIWDPKAEKVLIGGRYSWEGREGRMFQVAQLGGKRESAAFKKLKDGTKVNRKQKPTSLFTVPNFGSHPSPTVYESPPQFGPALWSLLLFDLKRDLLWTECLRPLTFHTLKP